MKCVPAARMAREDSDRADRAWVLVEMLAVPRELPDSVVALEVLAEGVAAVGSAVRAAVGLADAAAVIPVSAIAPDAEAIRMLLVAPVLLSAIAATVVNRPFAGCFPCRFATQPWMLGHFH